MGAEHPEDVTADDETYGLQAQGGRSGKVLGNDR
jgi:hypothetical protein